MRQVWCVRLIGVVLLSGSCSGARAGAFLDPPGKGEVIVTTSFTDSANAFDAAGKLVPVASYRKFELSAWTEYGLTDWLTVIVAPSLDHIVNSDHPSSSYQGLGTTEAGARVPVVQTETGIFSVQATVLVPGSFDRSNPALVGNNAFESDARLLYARSFAVSGRSSFIDVEAGYRWYEIGPGEARADLTFGIRPLPIILLLAQSFNVVSIGPGAAYAPNHRWDKLEASVVYDFATAWSAQFGAFATVAAVNARRERGLVAAIWHRF